MYDKPLREDCKSHTQSLPHTTPLILKLANSTHLENSEEAEDDTLARYLAHVLRDGGGTASILPPNQVPRVDAAAVVGVLSFAMTRPQAGVQLAPLWPVPPVWTELLHQGHGNPTWAQASAGGSSAAALAAHHSSSRGKVAGEVGPATARRWYRTMSSMVLFDFLIYNHANRYPRDRDRELNLTTDAGTNHHPRPCTWPQAGAEAHAGSEAGRRGSTGSQPDAAAGHRGGHWGACGGGCPASASSSPGGCYVDSRRRGA